MKFYTSISKVYDHIFPYKPTQKDFVKSFLAGPGQTVLDIGCSTGTLAIELAKDTVDLFAIDSDKEMIKIAQQKNLHENLNFYTMDMRKISKAFAADFFDVIYSFGNTLVHLFSLKEIDHFIKSLSNVLNPEGKLLLQILNYDHILKHKIRLLPLIENDIIRFERYYDFRNENWINFSTILTIKKSGETIENRIKLFPLTKYQLHSVLQKNGFGNIEFYRDFSKNSYTGSHLPLVVSCELI